MRAVIIYVAAPYLAVIVIFTVFQRRLIYQPERSEGLARNEADFLPHSRKAVALPVDGGLILNGWLIRSNHPIAESERWLAIYFPGNSGHRDVRRRDLLEVADAGFDVLIFDYRGYGDNPGSPSERALTADARAIWEEATRQRGYSAGRILLFGESLGGAVAIALCADVCKAGEVPAGLTVVSSFSSLPDVAASLYPAFPFRFLLFDRYDAASRIADIRCPIAIIHGEADDIVPSELGRRLFDAAPTASADGVPKQWELVLRMGHNDVPQQQLSTTLRNMAGE